MSAPKVQRKRRGGSIMPINPANTRSCSTNAWLWGAVLLSLLLQAAVIYVPVLQQAFSTLSLSFNDWLHCAAVASSVLWLRELSKVLTRVTSRMTTHTSRQLASGGE